MRKLYILRGVQGSGKSTFIKENNLEQFTISSDDLRKKFESTAFDLEGKPYITQTNNKAVWKLMFELIEARMQKNCLTFVDATHCNESDFRPYLELAKKYRYEMKIIDFDLPLEELLERNKNRPLINRLDEQVIHRFYERKQNKFHKKFNFILPKDINNELIYKVKDFSKYEKVIFFGDLQGCYQSLEDYFKDNPFNENYLYIFVGDYVDRGIENHKVIKFLLNFIKNDNVILMKGNHEYHLDRWVRGREAFSKVFNKETAPQLEKNDITRSEVNQICSVLKDFLRFNYRGKEITVTHTGMPFYPKNDDVYKIPSHQYIRGIGSYNEDIDSMWNERSQENQYQVHGHRNRMEYPIINNRSMNLEGAIEFGGNLRILTLDKDGFKELYYKQNIFDKKLVQKKEEKNMTFLERLRNNDLIREKDLGNNISSFNFTRKAFYKKAWDDMNVKARGLFIDIKKEKIVARSYNKFFNLGEREETQDDYLKKNLKFPITAYQKDNGFLGILSCKNGELFYASKSTNKSDFAGWFKDIVENTLDTNAIKNVLRKENMTMVFEVNDPVNDPHIVEYDKAHVVLLDVIHNKEKFSKLPYTQLKGIGKKVNANVKIQTKVLSTWDDYQRWLKEVSVPDNLLEGYVIEDSNSFMFKIKLEYYSFWKYMRTVRDRLRTDKDISEASIKDKGYETFFFNWMKDNLSKKELELDIITLRNRYYKENKNENS